ncbi:hypothetical protein [Streptomyces sp. STR69]|uniref:hypothetical protein n=1 Tax=Streptomyces sp. STR69 TaxID=1796942 RepID=UPI0021C96D9A|nr:hypothetical protein [Streptomyces sp. STR69]
MSIQLRHGDDLRRISRELRRMDSPEIKKRFRKELRSAARPLVPKVRTAIRAIPSGRSYSADGLRGQLSKATRLEIKTAGKEAGVALRVDGRKMPAHMKSLPAMVEGTKRWRHPVYGNRENWVNQGREPYFYKTVRVAGPLSRQAVSRVLTGITRDIS